MVVSCRLERIGTSSLTHARGDPHERRRARRGGGGRARRPRPVDRPLAAADATPSARRSSVASDRAAHVFSPLALGPVELRNRIVSTAHQTTLVDDHLPTDDFVAYHEARARGGVGLIVLEATASTRPGSSPRTRSAATCRRSSTATGASAEAVQPHGTRLFVQLLHGGREQIAGPPRAPALAPSAVPSPRFRVAAARAATTDEIEEIVARLRARLPAARQRAGSTGSRSRQRTATSWSSSSTRSSTGATTNGREPSRFLLEVVRAVRAAAPGLASASGCPPTRRRRSGSRRRWPREASTTSHSRSATRRHTSGSVGHRPAAAARRRPLIEPQLGPFRLGLPLIATSRVVDPADAPTRLIG